MKSLVSVIIPSYNASKYIRETIESILKQSYLNYEIIIVDDGSTDNTYAICKKYEEKYSKVKLLVHYGHSNKGPSISRSFALKHALGEYVCFCDSDDVLEVDSIERRLRIFEKHKDIVLVHSGVSIVSDEQNNVQFINKWFSEFKEETRYNLLKKNCFRENHICNSTIMAKKDLVVKIDFSFKQKYQYEDWFFLILIAQFGDFVYTPKKLTKYRYHSLSASYKVMNDKFLDMFSRIELYVNLLCKMRINMLLERVKIIAYMLISIICICLKKIGLTE